MSTDMRKLLESLGGSENYREPAPMPEKEGNTNSTGLTTSVETRALNLLGNGIGAEAVAAALGVTAARVSQLLSDEAFALKVATLRYEKLQEANERDGNYDSIEDELLTKLQRSLPLMMKPETILRAISVVNNAKRRGQSAPEQAATNQNIVNIVLPEKIVNLFTTNLENRVISTGDQDLLTIPSGTLLAQIEDKHRQAQQPPLIESDEPSQTTNPPSPSEH